MAENKKGFLLYADYNDIFNGLTDKQAGKLVKLIFSYVNDENPEVSEQILKIAFEPIKKQLKRDLKKYEEIKIKRSNAGKASSDSRKRQNSTKSTHVESVEQTSTKSTVTDNVNDTVTDNVINKKRDHVLTFPFGSTEFLTAWKKWVEYREEIKKPYNSFSSEQTELQTLGSYTEPEAVKMINTAIKNGWKNIRPNDLLPTKPLGGMVY